MRERERLDFSKIQSSIQIPNLIEVQSMSYQRFLQMDLLPSEREDGGLQSVFSSVFPIQDFRGLSQLDFVDYAIGNWECKCGNLKGLHHLRATCRNCGASVVTNPYQTGDVICTKCGTFNKNTPTFCDKCGDPVGMQLKYDVNECQERGMTYAAPLKVTIRLTIYDKDPDTGAKNIRDIKEQEVFFGDIPLMTDNGTFVINGTERVIVSQLHRSPGVFYETANNRSYFLGKIIPYRGSWVEFEYDTKNILYVRIDRKRKFLGSIFLRALGMKSNEEILRTFYQVERITLRDGDLHWNLSEGLIDRKLSHEIKNPKSDEVLVAAHKRITEPLYKELVKAKVAAGARLPGRSGRRLLGRRSGEPPDRRSAARSQQAADRRNLGGAARSGHHQRRRLFPGSRRRRRGALAHARQGRHPFLARSADRNLPQAASRRSADARNRHGAVQRDVLRSAQVRLQQSRPPEVQHQARPGNAAATRARSIPRTSSRPSATC